MNMNLLKKDVLILFINNNKIFYIYLSLLYLCFFLGLMKRSSPVAEDQSPSKIAKNEELESLTPPLTQNTPVIKGTQVPEEEEKQKLKCLCEEQDCPFHGDQLLLEHCYEKIIPILREENQALRLQTYNLMKQVKDLESKKKEKKTQKNEDDYYCPCKKGKDCPFSDDYRTFVRTNKICDQNIHTYEVVWPLLNRKIKKLKSKLEKSQSNQKFIRFVSEDNFMTFAYPETYSFSLPKPFEFLEKIFYHDDTEIYYKMDTEYWAPEMICEDLSLATIFLREAKKIFDEPVKNAVGRIFMVKLS